MRNSAIGALHFSAEHFFNRKEHFNDEQIEYQVERQGNENC